MRAIIMMIIAAILTAAPAGAGSVANKKETPLQSMYAALEKANSGGRLFESVAIKGNEAVIEVNLKWYRLPKGDRLNLAQALWKWWALTINPDNPDKAYIKIVDPNGNRVGGSGFLGSLVKVDD